jgi:hypothetical protein
MWGTKDMRFTLPFAALVAATAFAAPAAAQTAYPQVNVESRALILQPASIAAGNALDFGTVLASPTLAGSVSVTPNATGFTVADAGGATAVSGASPGTFNGNGTPGSQVDITVTWTPVLRHTNGIDTLNFVGNSYGAGMVTIPADGLFRVAVGGTINVAANQAPGQYSGRVYVDAVFQ